MSKHKMPRNRKVSGFFCWVDIEEQMLYGQHIINVFIWRLLETEKRDILPVTNGFFPVESVVLSGRK